MNTKSVLIAALIAASTGSVFAADYTATAGNPSVQIAQAAPAAAEPTRAQVRAVAVAARTDGTNDSSKDTAPFATTSKADARPRAEVRAEVRAFDKNWIASRVNRDVTEGAAQ